MFQKIGILGSIALAFSMAVPSMAQPRVHHPRGYYYRAGRWHLYRGRGFPYRDGYYDRRGRWHRFR